MVEVLEIIKIISLGTFLFVEGIRDLRKHKISMLAVIVAGVMGGILQFDSLEENGWEILGGIFIGIALLILAKVTKEKIGYGDGWVLMVSGIYLGVRGNMYLLLLSLFLASLVSICLLVFKKVNKKTELPFVSFVLPGYLLLLVKLIFKKI